MQIEHWIFFAVLTALVGGIAYGIYRENKKYPRNPVPFVGEHVDGDDL